MNQKYILLVIPILIISCGIFGTKENEAAIAENLPQPPQKISDKDAELIVASRPVSTKAAPATSTQVPPKKTTATKKQPRIEEDRDLGGSVDQIKVNNQNLPSYYIYPEQPQNWNTNQIPDRNIATPNWQINW